MEAATTGCANHQTGRLKAERQERLVEWAAAAAWMLDLDTDVAPRPRSGIHVVSPLMGVTGSKGPP